MKLTIDTITLIERFGERRALEMIKQAGYDGVDFGFSGWDKPAPEEMFGEGYREYANKVKGILDELSLICDQAHAPFSFTENDEVDPEGAKFKEIIRSIESAAVLGAKSIVVHSVDVANASKFTEFNYNFFKKLEPYAEKNGIKISIETLVCYDPKRKHFKDKMNTPEAINSFVEKLGTKNFNVCVDLGHSCLTGLEPDEMIEGITPGLLQHLHVQDSDYTMDSHIPPFFGNFDWKKIMAALKKVGYEGNMSFEIFGFFRQFSEDIIPEVLAFTVAIGKKLTSYFEEA